VQGAGATLAQLLFDPGTDPGVGAGEFEGVDGAAHVQPRAADEDRRTAFGEQAVDLRSGQSLVLGDARCLGDVPDVEELVRDVTALLGRQLGGSDVHPPVELHGVGVDDFTAQPLSQDDPQIGLSGRGGADDSDDPRGGSSSSHCASLANLGAVPERAK
jgi:hypothetical protein